MPESEVDPNQAEGDGGQAVQQQPAEADQAADPESEKPAPKFPSPVSLAAWMTLYNSDICLAIPFIPSGTSVADCPAMSFVLVC